MNKACTLIALVALSFATTMRATTNVFGTPNTVRGHPRLLWDKEEIAHYQELLKTDGELKSAVNDLKEACEKRVLEPLNLPAYTQEPDGQRTFPDYPKGYKNEKGVWVWSWNFNRVLQKRAEEIRNLGVLYALSGNERYAGFAKQLLLALVDT